MRKLLISCVSIFVMVLVPVGMAESPSDTMKQSIEETVLAVEDAYVAAEVAKDEAALRRLVDDRFVMNNSDGTTTDKEGLIQTVLKMPMTGQDLRQRSVLVLDDSVVIFGTAVFKFSNPEGEEKEAPYRYTSTYIERQGEWRLVALHMNAYTGD